MNQILKLVDYRGELGRLSYFSRSIYRIPLMIAGIAINFGLNLLIGYPPSVELFQTSLSDPLVTVMSLVFFLPLTIRRANDAGISFWWVIVFEILYLVPEPSEDMASYGIYTLLVSIPYLVWCLIIVFKPGKDLREHRRSNAT